MCYGSNILARLEWRYFLILLPHWRQFFFGGRWSVMIRCNASPTLLGLKNRLRAFARARDWEQFHTPKNLAVSIVIEAGELLEIFQWLSDAQASQITKSKENMELIRDEMADVFVYLIRLADILGIDLTKAAARKIVRNSKKYPVAAAKGNAVKYGRRRAR